jgi:endonuclease G
LAVRRGFGTFVFSGTFSSQLTMGIRAGYPRKAQPQNNRFTLLLLLGLVAAFLYYKDDLTRWWKGTTATETRADQPPARPETTEDVATDQRPLRLPGRDGEPEVAASTAVPAPGDLEAYLPAYRRTDQLVRRRGYVLQYEEPYEQAAWVVHRLTGQGGTAKRASKFSPDPLVKTGSALPTDYTRTGYDRGHLAPAGDFKYDQELTNESFYMSNISPQDHAFNTGIWSDLENQARRWAGRYKNLIVVTGPVLKRGLPTIGQRNQVAVPEAFYKIILDPTPGRERAIAFLMPNAANFNKQVRDFVVSIDEVERQTGLDFFAQYPKPLQTKLERTAQAPEWYRN